MNIELPECKYIVAVSGGVDSVVLLDILTKNTTSNTSLVVAHFDHGIRLNSGDDATFVGKLAEKYDLPYELGEGSLGENASEATARHARYIFLEEVRKKHAASAIITAHHQDDLIETAVINLLRGSGRRGLTSLRNRLGIYRPLLRYTKEELKQYATTNSLEWREDPTNADPKYLRNKIRNQLLPKAGVDWLRSMLAVIARAEDLNGRIDREIDQIVGHLVNRRGATISRSWFVKLPHEIATEIILAILRRVKVHDIDSRLIERLTIGIKSAKIGAKLDIDKEFYMLVTKRSARIMHRKTGKTVKL